MEKYKSPYAAYYDKSHQGNLLNPRLNRLNHQARPQIELCGATESIFDDLFIQLFTPPMEYTIDLFSKPPTQVPSLHPHPPPFYFASIVTHTPSC